MDLDICQDNTSTELSVCESVGGRIMSDEIIDVVEDMIVQKLIDDLNQKVDMLRSEVDTIGNVLLQLIHARNVAIERGEE